jgi:TPR repeat protein
MMYYDGRGVAKDERAAYEWFEKAAKLDYEKAIRMINIIEEK